MISDRTKQFALCLLRAAIGGLFCFSGFEKLIRPVEEFQYVIESYKTFPALFIPMLSHVIPWYELIFGIFLAVGLYRKYSAFALNVLCAGFLILLITAQARGIPLGSCGCFGQGIHLSPLQATILDAVIFLSLMIVFRSKHTAFEIDRVLR